MEALDRAASFGRPLKGKGGGLKGAIFHPVAQKGEVGKADGKWVSGRCVKSR